jgi:hypothetical protein
MELEHAFRQARYTATKPTAFSPPCDVTRQLGRMSVRDPETFLFGAPRHSAILDQNIRG